MWFIPAASYKNGSDHGLELKYIAFTAVGAYTLRCHAGGELEILSCGTKKIIMLNWNK